MEKKYFKKKLGKENDGEYIKKKEVQKMMENIFFEKRK